MLPSIVNEPLECHTELREAGYLHSSMRMYWGEKIVASSNTPPVRLSNGENLNKHNHLYDGRDLHSYGNIAWVFGPWDRTWEERDIDGKVRTMTAAGLERTADLEPRVSRIESLTGLEVRR